MKSSLPMDRHQAARRAALKRIAGSHPLPQAQAAMSARIMAHAVTAQGRKSIKTAGLVVMPVPKASLSNGVTAKALMTTATERANGARIRPNAVIPGATPAPKAEAATEAPVAVEMAASITKPKGGVIATMRKHRIAPVIAGHAKVFVLEVALGAVVVIAGNSAVTMLAAASVTALVS
jgi:hypothetical protein